MDRAKEGALRVSWQSQVPDTHNAIFLELPGPHAIPAATLSTVHAGSALWAQVSTHLTAEVAQTQAALAPDVKLVWAFTIDYDQELEYCVNHAFIMGEALERLLQHLLLTESDHLCQIKGKDKTKKKKKKSLLN